MDRCIFLCFNKFYMWRNHIYFPCLYNPTETNSLVCGMSPYIRSYILFVETIASRLGVRMKLEEREERQRF